MATAAKPKPKPAPRPKSPDSKYVWSTSRKRWVPPAKPANGTYVWVKNQGWKKTADSKGNPSNPALDWLRTNYGLTEALIDADPTDPSSGFSMKEAFDQIRAQGITDGNRAAQLIAKTTWWKAHGITALQRLALKTSQPGVWQQNIDDAVASLREAYLDSGLEIPDAALRKIAEDKYVYDISDASLRKVIYNRSDITENAGSTTVEQLRALANDYGVTRTDQQLIDAARGIELKQQSANDYKEQLKSDAASRMPYWADQIAAGKTVKDLAAGYVNDVQTLLEDPNADTTHDLVKKALTNIGADGKPAPVPLWKFEQMVRQDSRWKNTKNGQQAYTNVGMNVLKSFGLME